MKKTKLKFINEGNGIEGIISVGEIDINESAKMKAAIKNKKTNLIWDPIFECFVPKSEDNTLEKGTVLIKKKSYKNCK